MGEVREAARVRRAKSLQRMMRWLELQDRANAEEGGPRVEEDEGLSGGASDPLRDPAASHGGPCRGVRRSQSWGRADRGE